MHVVVTAGHVDHGKSTLIRALTGRDPDRLEEERRRGLSIELGYAWTELPGAGEVAFVDVPGHQRFVSTALAGMGPAPVALFVVAADDPWMPQAQEHLDALDALGVERLEQVGDMLLDGPGAVPGGAAVAAQVDREPAALRERLLRQPAVALSVGGHAVHGQRRRSVGRSIVMKVENGHRPQA
jgi:hypothetical protein